MDTLKWIFVAVGLILLGAAFNGSAPAKGREAAPAWEATPAATVAAPEPERTLTLQPGWKYVASGFGTVKIVGTVTNDTGRDIGYAQISFTGFDKSGAQVDTALANMANLKAGARWRFEAVSFKQGGVWRYELGELIGN